VSTAALVVLFTHAAIAVASDAGPTAKTEAPAPVAAPSARQDDALSAAADDFAALRLEAAAERLEALVADATTPRPTLAQAWLLLGLTRAGLLADNDAAAAFSRALDLDASLEVPAETSPKVRALFEKTRRARPPAPPPSPPPPPTKARPADSTSTQPKSASAPAQPAPAAPTADDTVLWTAGLASVVLVTAAGAAVGAVVADDALGRPEAGRTRADHDLIRMGGLVSVGASAVLGVVGGGLVAAAVWDSITPESGP